METQSSYSYIRQIDFKTKTVIGDEGRHCIMIKGSIQQEDITFVNIYAPNIEALNM